jgi:hypothetical protein
MAKARPLGIGVVVVACGCTFMALRRSSRRVDAWGPASSEHERFDPPANPVLDRLRELQAEGMTALHTFTTCEGNLWEEESGGQAELPPHAYDVWHEAGALDLRRWLVQVGQEVEQLMGHKAVLGMRYQLAIAPQQPVPPRLREDYAELWVAGWQQLQWLRDLVAKGSTREGVVDS